MKLKQADKSIINYPSRYHFKPILLGVGAAVVLSGCASNEVKEPAYLAGGPIGGIGAKAVKNQQTCKVPIKSEKVEQKEEVKDEVKEPEILGGVPPLQPTEPKKN